MKTILLLQAWGLGDILWSQSIAHKFIEQGYKVVWPVKNDYFEGLCNAYPQIHWVPDSIVRPEIFMIKEKIEFEGMTIAPIRWSNSFMDVPYKDVMRAKYDMYDMQWQEWKNHAQWVRNFNKEVELYKELGLQPGEKYNLINTRFGSGVEKNIEIRCNNGYKNIELKILPGYSIFDWAKIILEAQEIHTVSTSLLFMLEVMPLFQPIHLYCRKPIESDFKFVEFLFTKPYILHE